MKTTLAWLRTHLDTTATLEEIVDECIARGWSLDADRPRAAELIDRIYQAAGQGRTA